MLHNAVSVMLSWIITFCSLFLSLSFFNHKNLSIIFFISSIAPINQRIINTSFIRQMEFSKRTHSRQIDNINNMWIMFQHCSQCTNTCLCTCLNWCWIRLGLHLDWISTRFQIKFHLMLKKIIMMLLKLGRVRFGKLNRENLEWIWHFQNGLCFHCSKPNQKLLYLKIRIKI